MQTSGDARRPRATIVAARWHIRRQSATGELRLLGEFHRHAASLLLHRAQAFGDGVLPPEQRRVGRHINDGVRSHEVGDLLIQEASDLLFRAAESSGHDLGLLVRHP
jgi:hypothetical protein